MAAKKHNPVEAHLERAHANALQGAALVCTMLVKRRVLALQVAQGEVKLAA
jgi:hypothetical protein